MNTRSVFPVKITNVNLLSSDTSTAVVTAVDMANYFPVGKREVRFVVAITTSSTTLGNALGGLVIEECASTATASFSQIYSVSGSTATFALAANAVSYSTWFDGFVNYRYLRTRYTGTTSTGGHIGINVIALPLVRAG
jgi:hypothetical protein